MISPDNRCPLDAAAYIESIRFGLWAQLVATKAGRLAADLLYHWGRVQELVKLILTHAGTDRLTTAMSQAQLVQVLPDANKTLRDAFDHFTNAKDCGKYATACAACTGRLQAVVEAALTAGKQPGPHPSEAPPPNGTHRSTRKSKSR